MGKGFIWSDLLKAIYENLEHQLLIGESSNKMRPELTWWKDLSKLDRRTGKVDFDFAGKILFKLGKESSIPLWSAA